MVDLDSRVHQAAHLAMDGERASMAGDLLIIAFGLGLRQVMQFRVSFAHTANPLSRIPR
jgi:hypothetical protein